MKLTSINLNSPPFLHIKIKESLPLKKLKNKNNLSSVIGKQKIIGCVICIIV